MLKVIAQIGGHLATIVRYVMGYTCNAFPFEQMSYRPNETLCVLEFRMCCLYFIWLKHIVFGKIYRYKDNTHI